MLLLTSLPFCHFFGVTFSSPKAFSSREAWRDWDHVCPPQTSASWLLSSKRDVVTGRMSSRWVPSIIRGWLWCLSDMPNGFWWWLWFLCSVQGAQRFPGLACMACTVQHIFLVSQGQWDYMHSLIYTLKQSNVGGTNEKLRLRDIQATVRVHPKFAYRP